MDGLKARRAQTLHAVTGDGRVRIDGRGNDACEPGGDQCLGAWPGAACMVARLQRHIGRTAAQPLTGVLLRDFEGSDLGVVEQIVLVPALADDLSRAI